MTGDNDRGEWLFARPFVFVRGVASLDGLPEGDRPEVAFIGRSNCGKSSFLNGLTGRRKLAIVSVTPGRTRQLNYFAPEIDKPALYMVDMPGYGHARAGREEVRRWTSLSRTYVQGRASLVRIFLLVDARRGIMNVDRSFMEMMDEVAVSFQLVLTKIDCLKTGELEARLEEVGAELLCHGAAHPEVLATSGRTGAGMDEARREVATLANLEVMGYNPHSGLTG
ncbi:MAG: ribosome biogenesis GTP-binding protein YihA/YsxC [Parvularculales bacterium]